MIKKWILSILSNWIWTCRLISV